MVHSSMDPNNCWWFKPAGVGREKLVERKQVKEGFIEW